jgi:hypothetical protein
MRHSRVAGLAVFALTFGAAVAQAQQPPHQRVGLWQNDMVMAGRNMTTKFCVDAATAARSSAFSAGVRKNANCKNMQITRNPDGSWTSVSTCEFRPGVMRTTRSDVRGDFNSKVTMTMRSPPTAAPEMSMTMTWLGPCLPGQKGGDVIMPNGAKISTLGGG